MRRNLLVCLLFAGLAVFYAATIRPGNRWGDDFALYILHAENIVHGRSYASTGYLYDPGAPEYSPRIYPPVFPLLLAPLYQMFGLNFIPLKLVECAFLILALVAVYFYWRTALAFPYLLALLLVVGFNPVLWDAKDDVLSDLPFLFFFYAAALLVQFAPRSGKHPWKWALLAGFALYLCAGTRGIGLTLFPGLILYDVLKRRRIPGFTLLALAAAGTLLLLQRLIIGPGLSSYADQFHPTASHFGYNLVAYARSLLAFWLVRAHRMFSLPLYLVLTGLACAGLWFHLRRGLTVVEALLAPYLLLVLLWSVSGVWRFLFPALPFFVYLVLLGLQRLSAGWPVRTARLALAGFLVLVGSSYLLSYHDLSFGPIAETDGSLSFNALCTVVRDRTGPEDVFIYRRARALALFTSRQAASYEPGDENELWSNARRIHATYLVTSNQFLEDREFLIPWVQKNSAAVIPVYRNKNYALYTLRSYPGKIVRPQGSEAASESGPETALSLSKKR